MNFIYNKLNDIRDENIKKEKVGQSGIVNENKDSKLLVAIKKLFHIKTTKEIVDEYMNNSNAKRLEFYAKKKNSIALTNYIDNMWYNLQAIEQTSNLYRALNLPFKLYLLGFTMVKNNKNSKCNGINESYYNHIYKGDKKLDYNNNKFFTETQKSNVLAFMEHSRWNALYIIYDFTRMSKEKINKNIESEFERLSKLTSQASEKEKSPFVSHKDLANKEHGCLTTYSELENLIKYKYEQFVDKIPGFDKDKLNKEIAQIYLYDYLDLDNIYEAINSIGYSIYCKNCGKID